MLIQQTTSWTANCNMHLEAHHQQAKRGTSMALHNRHCNRHSISSALVLCLVLPFLLGPLSRSQAASTAGMQQRQHRQKYTRADLLVVMPSMLSRIALVRANRLWRKGVKTFILSDNLLPANRADRLRAHRETWGTYKDINRSPEAVGPQPGDLRAAMAPFVANITVSNWKWMLYGDDDTVFMVDNVLRVLNALDHSHPYFISDCLWFPQGGNGTKLHPNREAPRCLPCNYRDPLLDEGTCPGHSGWIAPKGCPCTMGLLCRSRWGSGELLQADGKGIMDHKACDFIPRPGSFHNPHVGWWYMVHGGAGAILSRGLMQRGHFADLEAYVTSISPQSGDAMLTRAVWHKLNIAPTDPGYGFCRAHIQMFDPGWAGPRALGPEDEGTADAGADPRGVVTRLEWALAGSERCDALCHDQLSHTLTVHVRGRYVTLRPNDTFPDAATRAIAAQHRKFAGAVNMIARLATLSKRYYVKMGSKRTSRDNYVPLWQD